MSAMDDYEFMERRLESLYDKNSELIETIAKVRYLNKKLIEENNQKDDLIFQKMDQFKNKLSQIDEKINDLLLYKSSHSPVEYY